MQKWDKIEIVMGEKRRMFNKSYFKIRENTICVEDDKGNGVCIPEKNVSEVHLIRGGKSKLSEVMAEIKNKLNDDHCLHHD